MLDSNSMMQPDTALLLDSRSVASRNRSKPLSPESVLLSSRTPVCMDPSVPRESPSAPHDDESIDSREGGAHLFDSLVDLMDPARHLRLILALLSWLCVLPTVNAGCASDVP